MAKHLNAYLPKSYITYHPGDTTVSKYEIDRIFNNHYQIPLEVLQTDAFKLEQIIDNRINMYGYNVPEDHQLTALIAKQNVLNEIVQKREKHNDLAYRTHRLFSDAKDNIKNGYDNLRNNLKGRKLRHDIDSGRFNR